MDQIDLFGGPGPHQSATKRTRSQRVRDIEAKRPHRRTLEERFKEFNTKYPEVYAELRRLAVGLLMEGRKRIGIGQLFEVARYNLRTNANEEGYKLNNSLRSRFSRALIAEVPGLAEAMETRELRAR